MNLEDVRESIDKRFPDLDLKSIEKIGEGMESIAYLINETLIFRFPKNAEARRCLKREIFALPRIKDHLKVAIPDFQYIAQEGHFVGYPKIGGEDLTKEVYESLSQQESDEILQILAEFLVDIHETNITSFPANGIEAEDFFAEYQSDLREIKKEIFSLLENEECAFIEQNFKEYLQNESNFCYRPVLLHNDLSADHILFDRVEKQLKGIIDFGDIGIGDADYDLMYLLDDYGEEFVRSLLRFYPHPDHPGLFDKLYFWDLVDILRLILHYKAENNPPEVESLIGHLRVRIQTMKTRRVLTA